MFYKVPSITLKESQKPKDGLMFAAFKRHIGLYPKPEVIQHFEQDLKNRKLKYAEGTIQFPLNKPVPVDLIKDIIAFKLQTE